MRRGNGRHHKREAAAAAPRSDTAPLTRAPERSSHLPHLRAAAKSGARFSDGYFGKKRHRGVALSSPFLAAARQVSTALAPGGAAPRGRTSPCCSPAARRTRAPLTPPPPQARGRGLRRPGVTADGPVVWGGRSDRWEPSQPDRARRGAVRGSAYPPVGSGPRVLTLRKGNKVRPDRTRPGAARLRPTPSALTAPQRIRVSPARPHRRPVVFVPSLSPPRPLRRITAAETPPARRHRHSLLMERYRPVLGAQRRVPPAAAERRTVARRAARAALCLGDIQTETAIVNFPASCSGGTHVSECEEERGLPLTLRYACVTWFCYFRQRYTQQNKENYQRSLPADTATLTRALKSTSLDSAPGNLRHVARFSIQPNGPQIPTEIRQKMITGHITV